MKRRRAFVVLLLLGAAVLFLLVAINTDSADSPRLFEPEERVPRERADLSSGEQADQIEVAQLAEREELRSMVLPEAPLESELSDLRTLRGTVELSDGTIAAGLELIIVHPDVPFGDGRRLADGKSNQELLFAHGWTSKEGEFEFKLKRPVPKEGFRIEQLNYRKLGQNQRIYEVASDTAIEHVVPGGRFSFAILDPTGGPVYGHVRIKIFFKTPGSGPDDEPYSSTSIPYHGNVARFFYPEPALITVKVVRPNDGAWGTLENVYLDPTRPSELHQLALVLPTETGRLKVRVLDQNELPVLEFGVRVSSRDGRYGPRYFYSADLGAEGILDGVPLGAVEVVLADKFGNPPSLYSTNEAPTRIPNLSRDSTPEVVFRVTIETRLAFDLQRESEQKEWLGVHYRTVGSQSEKWATTQNLSTFLVDEGGVRFGGMEEDGIYYTEILSAGHFDVEVFEIKSKKVVWSGTTQIYEGRLTPILLRL